MRDIALTLVVVGLLPVCFARPWLGVLVWSWLGFMNPSTLAWGFAKTIPFSMMVGAATLLGFVLTQDRNRFIWNRETGLILALWAWVSITTVTALYPEQAYDGWNRFSKILLMALVTVPLFQDRRRLRLLLLVIAGSIGFWGLKDGIWVVQTAGQSQVWGPPGSTFITDNNAMALALNMCLPLLLYLAREESRRWLRRILYLTFAFSILAIPFTYSRSGFLGFVVVLAMLFLKARTRLRLIPVVVATILLFEFFVPANWAQRMATIWHPDQDSSAQSRLTAWGAAYNLALDHPLVGGGFRSIAMPDTFLRYLPKYEGSFYNAHSIYFNVLGEHGFVGLGLFIALIASVVLSLHRLSTVDRESPDLTWVSNYARALQASIVGYLVGGAFLSLAYFDLPYHFFAVVAILKHMAAQHFEVARPRRRAGDPGSGGPGAPMTVRRAPPGLGERSRRAPSTRREPDMRPGAARERE